MVLTRKNTFVKAKYPVFTDRVSDSHFPPTFIVFRNWYRDAVVVYSDASEREFASRSRERLFSHYFPREFQKDISSRRTKLVGSIRYTGCLSVRVIYVGEIRGGGIERNAAGRPETDQKSFASQSPPLDIWLADKNGKVLEVSRRV